MGLLYNAADGINFAIGTTRNITGTEKIPWSIEEVVLLCAMHPTPCDLTP